MEGKFDVFEVLLETLGKNNTKLQDGDVLVISTKYISNSQGRIIELQKIITSDEGVKISKKFQLKPEIAEIIIRESDKIFGGIGGFVITASDNIMAPNAGIDKSNAKKRKSHSISNKSISCRRTDSQKNFLKMVHSCWNNSSR